MPGPQLAIQNLSLVAGDTYRAADGRAIAFDGQGLWPNLTGAASIAFKVFSIDNTLIYTNAVGSVTASNVAAVQLANTDTAWPVPNGRSERYRYSLSAVLADGNSVTLAGGILTAIAGGYTTNPNPANNVASYLPLAGGALSGSVDFQNSGGVQNATVVQSDQFLGGDGTPLAQYSESAQQLSLLSNSILLDAAANTVAVSRPLTLSSTLKLGGVSRSAWPADIGSIHYFDTYVTNPTSAGTWADPLLGIENAPLASNQVWALTPNKVYAVTNSINIAKFNLEIRGNGATIFAKPSSYWGQSSNNAILQSFHTPYPSTQSLSGWNLRVYNLNLDGNGQASIGVNQQYASYDYWERVDIDNCVNIGWLRNTSQLSLGNLCRINTDLNNSDPRNPTASNRVQTQICAAFNDEQGSTWVSPNFDNGYKYCLYMGAATIAFDYLAGVQTPGNSNTFIGGTIQFAGTAKGTNTTQNQAYNQGWNVYLDGATKATNFIGVDVESSASAGASVYLGGRFYAPGTSDNGTNGGTIPDWATKAVWDNGWATAFRGAWMPSGCIYYLGTQSTGCKIDSAMFTHIWNDGGYQVLDNPMDSQARIFGSNAGQVSFVNNTASLTTGGPGSQFFGGAYFTSPNGSKSLGLLIDNDGLARIFNTPTTRSNIVLDTAGNVVLGSGTNDCSLIAHGPATIYQGTYGANSNILVLADRAGSYSAFQFSSAGANNNQVTIGNGYQVIQQYNAQTLIGDPYTSGGQVKTTQDFVVGANVGFYGTSPQVKQTVTGAKGGNAALTSLLNALATLGLITNSTT